MTQKTLFAAFATVAVASTIFTSVSLSAVSAETLSIAQPARRKPTPASRYLTTANARGLADRAIDPAQLKDYLSFIASDEMQGRDTPSNGLNTVAKFLAMNLSRWGFKPAGDDGTFFQKIPLSRSRIDPTGTQANLSGTPLTYPDNFVVSSGRGRGGAGANVDIAESSLVYVGQGYVLPKRNLNPYTNLDVKGKILLVKQLATQRFPGGPDFAGAVSPQQYGLEHGAAGILYLSDSATTYAQLRTSAATPRGGFSPSAELQRAGGRPRVSPLPTLVLSPDLSQRLFIGEKSNSVTNVPFELAPDKKFSAAVRYTTETVLTQNVVAIWQGSDPALASEYVALGAHYDHVGMSATPDASGDSIFNGADDDGSGTAALLAIADALHQAGTRPRRSILFVWHCGEEKGLWGSSYFTSHPTVPLNKISAQLNIDMIGRSKLPGDAKAANANLSGPQEIFVIGSRMMSTQLGDLSERVNKGYQNLKFNYIYDDPNDPNRFFYRSDHVNYARKGVPIIFWFDGVHEDYHRLSDEVSKIDFQKMTLVTRTVLLTATEIANLPKKLVVDKKLALPDGE